MQQTKKLIFSSFITSILLMGCGSGENSSSSTNNNSNSQTGTLIDNVVSGIKYINGTNTGFTDENGQFSYTSGNIAFYLGGIKIGELNSLPNDKNIFTQDLAGVERTNTTDEKVLKIASLLQSLDSDSTTDKIEITKTDFDKFNGENKNINDIDLYSTLTTKGFVKKSDENVKQHMEDGLKAFNIIADTTAPYLKNISLSNNSIDVSINPKIIIEFSEKIPMNYVNNNYFILKDSSNRIIDFDINANSNKLSLSPKIPLNYSSNYTLTIKSSIKDFAGNLFINEGGNDDVTINFTTQDEIDTTAPMFKTSSTISVNENQIEVIKVEATDSSKITYSIENNNDFENFNIDSSSGNIVFKTAPDYETKNSYSISIKATDSMNNSSILPLTITIIDLNENNIPNNEENIIHNNLNYKVITSPITGKKWLDRNLGATQVCTSLNDNSCYGDYYQWGRLTDGHEKINANIISIPSNNITNAGDSFIETNDWTTIDQNGEERATQWSNSTICPTGFKVPNIEELKNETVNYDKNNDFLTGAVKVIDNITAFQNFLKLPSAGFKSNNKGTLYYSNVEGQIWSSTPDFTNGLKGAYNLTFSSTNTVVDFPSYRGYGLPVRCIEKTNSTDTTYPIFTTPNTVQVNENQTNVLTVNATDNSVLRYVLSGTDSDSFYINSSTGTIRFKTAPDYEIKNIYSITVIAIDTADNKTSQNLIININNLDELITHNGFSYKILTSPITGKKWLDRNLGATKVCENPTDEACYGDYYQWGRLTDGHEKANSITTTTLATNINNAGNKFISNDYDWTNLDENKSLRNILWSKTDGTGICPLGFRVPTENELKIETSNYTNTNNIETGAVKIINIETALQNFLKLPLSGIRDLAGINNTKNNAGFLSTLTNTIIISDEIGWDNFPSVFGTPVRCIGE